MQVEGRLAFTVSGVSTRVVMVVVVVRVAVEVVLQVPLLRLHDGLRFVITQLIIFLHFFFKPKPPKITIFFST